MNSKSLYAAGRESADKTFLHATLNLLRQRRTLILLAGAIVVAVVAFNWQRLAAADLLRVLFLAPCMIMMFMCMRHAVGSRSDNGATRDPRPTDRDCTRAGALESAGVSRAPLTR